MTEHGETLILLIRALRDLHLTAAHRLEEFEKGLIGLSEAKTMEEYPNRFVFTSPIRSDSGPLLALKSRLLDTHRLKHQVEYRLLEENGFVTSVEWGKCDEQHSSEVKKFAEWVQKAVATKKEAAKN